MARIHAKAVAHYVDEFDFSGVNNSAELVVDANIADGTAFADVQSVYLEGKAGANMSFQGFIDLVAGGYDAEMFIDLTTVDRLVGIYNDNLTGEKGYEMQSNPSRQARVTGTDQVALLNVDWVGTTLFHRAILLDVNTVVGATAQDTALQQGAVSSTQSIRGVLRLLAAPGGGGNNTLDVTIDSDDEEAFGGSAETQLTFTQLTQASVALTEVQTAAGAITDDWWRVDYVFAGAGSRTFSLVIAFGIFTTAG